MLQGQLVELTNTIDIHRLRDIWEEHEECELTLTNQPNLCVDELGSISFDSKNELETVLHFPEGQGDLKLNELTNIGYSLHFYNIPQL